METQGVQQALMPWPCCFDKVVRAVYALQSLKPALGALHDADRYRSNARFCSISAACDCQRAAAPSMATTLSCRIGLTRLTAKTEGGSSLRAGKMQCTAEAYRLQ